MSPIRHLLLVVTLAAGSVSAAPSPAARQLLDGWRGEAGADFSAAAGERLWRQTVTTDGDARRCATCHGDDLTRAGKHARTGKAIEPLAPSANPKRLTDVREMEKWFLRNCKWTFGRECSAREKGDLLSYLLTQ
jgi:hypothetical protein